MSTSATSAPVCRNCAQPLGAPYDQCRRCGSSQAYLPVPYGGPPVGYGPPTVIRVMTPKSPGIAVLLTLLWLGAGHLYANRVATGVVLIITELLLALVSLTGVGLIVTIPVWIILLPIVMFLSYQAVRQENRRNGMIL